MPQILCDLHIHSCLSPCGGEDMTPADIAGMAFLAGLRLFALTDHNTCGNCAAVAEAASRHGLAFVPGMELTTAEEVHVLCYFPTVAAAEEFSELVYSRLPDVKIDREIYGRQLYMNADDEIIAEEPRLLGNATDIGIYEVSALLAPLGGVAVPAHIDRESFSLFSNLGFYDAQMNFKAFEITHDCETDKLLAAHPELSGARLITGSDAHSLGLIGVGAGALGLPERSATSVIRFLRGGL